MKQPLTSRANPLHPNLLHPNLSPPPRPRRPLTARQPTMSLITRRLLLLTVTAAALAALSVPKPASAYTLLTLDSGRTIVKWAGGLVSFEINANLLPTLTDDVAAVLAGMSAWSSLPCAAVSVTDRGLTQASGASYTGGFDGVNRVVYVAAQNWRAEDSSALAVTTFNFNQTQLAEADISFNGSYQWSTTGQSGKFDVQGVATHEIGHFFGILHTQDASATMYPSTGPNELGPRSLAPDDTQAFCFLYPKAGVYACDTQNRCPQVNYYDQFGRDRALGQMQCVDGLCVLGGEAPSLGMGDVCQDSTQCADDLLCAENAGERRCTQPCALGQAGQGCPQGFQCVTAGFVSEDGLCWLEGQGTVALGGECLFSSECVDGLCVLDPTRAAEGVGLCSKLCREGVGTCPQDTLCLPIPIPGRSACLPTGDGQPGQACESFIDCEGGRCLRDAQGSACRAGCDAQVWPDGCAAGSACLRTLYGDACLGVGSGAPGTACGEAFDCDSLLCLPAVDGGESLCSARCDQDHPCGEGLTCQFFGAGQEFCVPGGSVASDTASDAAGGDAGDAQPVTGSSADAGADLLGGEDVSLGEVSDDGCGCRIVGPRPLGRHGERSLAWVALVGGVLIGWRRARRQRVIR